MSDAAALGSHRRANRDVSAAETTLPPAGGYRVERMSRSRRIGVDAYDAMPRGHKMLALLELDVTEAQRAIERLREDGVRVSLFSFVVSAIAATLAEFPALNVKRQRYKLFLFDDVDVMVPVELSTSEGLMPRQVVVRRAQTKNAAQIFAEIERARAEFGGAGYIGAEDRWARRLALIGALLPRFLRLFLVRRLTHSALMAKRFAGTTSVTSVSKFATIPGFVVPFMDAPMTAMFALGSTVDKPAVIDGRIVVRSFLSVSIVLDHDVIDGAPAGRFAKRLQERIEGALGLTEPVQPSPSNGLA